MGSVSFPDKVHRTAERYGMDLRHLLALVSGGPDSVALLRVVVALGGEPVVLHVDHGLRGEESRADAEFVRDLCRRSSLRCEVRRIMLDDSSNLQEWARDERYRLAEEVADGIGLGVVATGHTADDVAETVLMNLARGTGLRGLAGIPPVRGKVQRPLIGCTRREILDYLREIDQPYRTDPTNLVGKYARNRVRLEVLPVLEELYPAALGNIARAASLFREDLEVLEELAAGVLEKRGEEVVLGGGRIAAGRVYGYDPVDADRPDVAYLDAANGPYEVRMAREGDIIRPLGLGGTKKVLRAMMDRKVPSDLRRRTPVVVDGRDAVAWIVLGELDERYKIDEKTEKVLRLEVARIS